MSGRTALVTGASSGIGLEVARALATRGYRVLGTTRNPDALQDSSRIAGVEYVALDLMDRSSIEACARTVGDVDILVNNAGESQMGPLEELPLDAMDRLFRVNVLGAVQLTQLLLPGMRERGYGRVVMVGSMLASFPLAFRSSYVASKCALKGFATAARRELSPFGVWLTTVEPGTIATGIGDRRTRYIGDDSPYTADYAIVSKGMRRNEDLGIRPDRVAALVVKAIEANKPKPLYAVGNKAPLVFTARRLAPRTAVEKMMARFHGLK
ncbi:SDR family oxidoreductase [Rhodococcus xishaensis]|uniref:SDR family oxidoreductase n=1 Tax=Rhodococcus xishaensis TaxID=2487364 RepID=A0A3S3CNY0_9NOCA|nr:SDR family oxidoreductase [Rhodococcus xishaensis]RVW02090.1 SDR family oxidoreductase [Rhodococcus xishaensis]